ncbi:hypothetical protein Q9299_09585 [Gemmobacter fulvus]|uniref:hypothetical protein n=1 Tax=Gemmobacter fulvus TaxID=2840474 RepID=UPI0027967E2F|nr:hypothetical protein [Gemmobacter fulvus]MDQ1848536.1 hypothetical protein [Gemmobacter fulvus]
MKVPSFPAHLGKAERRAVLLQAARDMAAQTIKDDGLDPSRVNVEQVSLAAGQLIQMQWLEDRIEALEKAARDG